MRPTKNDMARVIVQALYAMPHLPAADHPEVVRRATRGNIHRLTYQHKMAVDALLSTVKDKTI